MYREKIGFDLSDREVIKEQYLKQEEVAEKEPNGENYLYGLLDRDIVYLHLGYVNEAWRLVKTLKESYPAAQGIIIDLWHNQGGDFTYALDALAELNDQKRLVFRSRTKNGSGPSDFTPWFSWYLESKGNGYPQKVVLLTDRFTISAAERATLMLQALPNVITIGDTTNGALSTMIPRTLPYGWYYTLAPQDVLAPDGKSYEGIGLAPDVYLVNRKSELEQGRDLVLEKAMEQFE